MPIHEFKKEEVIQRLEALKGLTFERIDNKGMFNQVKEFSLQKGIAGSIVEQCIFDYPADTKQEADLLILEGGESIKTELKTTGLIKDTNSSNHYVAKEPMSITGVGVFDIAEQEFYNSHFWEKLEHMLIVYYHYAASHAVKAYEYKDFPLVGYEFHEFSDKDKAILKQDWEHVKALCAEVVSHHPGMRDSAWKEAVKEEYIAVHGQLRRVLNYIDLAPKFPPRFRLKRPVVSSIIAEHFSYKMAQLPEQYASITEIDLKCRELTSQFKGWTIEQLANHFHIQKVASTGRENKSIAEQIVVSMFGGKAKKINQIEIFRKFGLIGKTITMTNKGGRTEDMKLFKVDFDEVAKQFVDDESGTRAARFEDSDMYTYFADHELLCILFQEPSKQEEHSSLEKGKKINHPLAENTFIGFKRLVFDDSFIDGCVLRLWQDTRNKIINKSVVDVVKKRRDGSEIINKSGSVSSSPNFLKSTDNNVFIRGAGTDSSTESKTEKINGLSFIPQYVWIRGKTILDELAKTPEI